MTWKLIKNIYIYNFFDVKVGTKKMRFLAYGVGEWKAVPSGHSSLRGGAEREKA